MPHIKFGNKVVQQNNYKTMKKINTVTILYYLFILIAIILFIKSLFFNDESHKLLVGIIIIGIYLLRRIK